MTPSERKALLFLAAVAVLGVGVRLAGSEPTSPAATLATRRALLRQIAAVDSVRAARESKERARGAGKGRGRGAADSSTHLERGTSRRSSRIKRDGTVTASSAVPPPPPNVVPWLATASPEHHPGPAAGGPQAGPRQATGAGGRAAVDVDRADAAALEGLPGIGPALAGRIVAERARNGPFGGLSGLDARVRGVGPALAARLAPSVTFSGVPRPPTADATPSVPTPGDARADRRTSRQRRPP